MEEQTVSTQAVELARPQQVALSQDAQEDVDGFRAIKYAAGIMAKSGCFSDIKGQDEETAICKAVVKIAIGRDYGFSIAESMQYIELIQGRPSIAAHARAAKMKAAGYYWKFTQFDAVACKLIVYGPKGDELGDSSFTIEDAKRMGLAEKDNWKKNPRNMLYCRAISNAQRWYAPEVLSASLASKEDVIDGEYTVIPDDVRMGTRADQEAVADRRLAEIAAKRETPEERDARIQRQIDEQTEEIKRKQAEAQAERPTEESGQAQDAAATVSQPRQKPVFGRPTR
jgi:hypothetical protein